MATGWSRIAARSTASPPTWGGIRTTGSRSCCLPTARKGPTSPRLRGTPPPWPSRARRTPKNAAPRMVVKEVTTRDRAVDEGRLRPEAMPFFASPDPVLASGAPGRTRGLAAQQRRSAGLVRLRQLVLEGSSSIRGPIGIWDIPGSDVDGLVRRVDATRARDLAVEGQDLATGVKDSRGPCRVEGESTRWSRPYGDIAHGFVVSCPHNPWVADVNVELGARGFVHARGRGVVRLQWSSR